MRRDVLSLDVVVDVEDESVGGLGGQPKLQLY